MKNILCKIGKVYSLKFTNTPKVFFMLHIISHCFSNVIWCHCWVTVHVSNALRLFLHWYDPRSLWCNCVAVVTSVPVAVLVFWVLLHWRLIALCSSIPTITLVFIVALQWPWFWTLSFCYEKCNFRTDRHGQTEKCSLPTLQHAK